MKRRETRGGAVQDINIPTKKSDENEDYFTFSTQSSTDSSVVKQAMSHITEDMDKTRKKVKRQHIVFSDLKDAKNKLLEFSTNCVQTIVDLSDNLKSYALFLQELQIVIKEISEDINLNITDKNFESVKEHTYRELEKLVEEMSNNYKSIGDLMDNSQKERMKNNIATMNNFMDQTKKTINPALLK